MTRDFDREQAMVAVKLAHLLGLAVGGYSPNIWRARAERALAEYQASRNAEHESVMNTTSAA